MINSRAILPCESALALFNKGLEQLETRLPLYVLMLRGVAPQR
jgi:hypothetical protein